jgi:hypothetical protein
MMEELAIAGGENIRGGWSVAEDFAETIDASAFKIDGGEERRANVLLAGF